MARFKTPAFWKAVIGKKAGSVSRGCRKGVYTIANKSVREAIHRLPGFYNMDSANTDFLGTGKAIPEDLVYF
jgi:hypothetical protein